MKYQSLIITLISISLLTSCSLSPGQTGARLVTVETAEGRALDEMLHTPTEFTLTYYQDQTAWERAISFFPYYLNQPQVLTTKKMITNKNVSGITFEYAVTRQYSKEGALYSVKCTPVPFRSNKVSAAIRNARNLSHFIKDGILERSFLELE